MSEDALPEFYFAHSARCCSLALPCCPVVRETYFLVRPCWTHGGKTRKIPTFREGKREKYPNQKKRAKTQHIDAK